MATTYTVKKGDTLSAIAKSKGTTVDAIAKANGISNPNKISVGQVLTIGDTTPTTTVPTTLKPASLDDISKSKSTQDAEKYRQDVLDAKPGEFTYDPYQSNWQTQLDDTINKILNREKFSYDLNGDALYQQYKDQYMLQGNMAMMDTMGQAAAMNGGYGSSYAQTVGQQTYQGYLQQLNDRVPELYQLALSQYNQEGEDLYNQYGLLNDVDDRDYTRYMDDVNMKYGLHRDSVTDWQDERDFANTEYWSSLGYDYQLAGDSRSDASNLALSMLSSGAMPSAEVLAAAGISTTDAQAMLDAAKKKITTDGDDSVINPVGDPVPTPDPTPEDYADWDAGDWESYFSHIRQTEGKEAAEAELKYFTSNGLIPTDMVVFGAIGARGGLSGH